MPHLIRGCRPEELDALNTLTNRIFRGDQPGNMRAEYPLLFSEANCEQLRVVERDGRLVAHVGICIRDALILGARVRVASIGAVALLGAEAVGLDDDHAVLGGALAGQRDRAVAHSLRQAGCVFRVETKLDRGRHLVDVLPTRSGGADEALRKLAFVDEDARRDVDARWRHGLAGDCPGPCDSAAAALPLTLTLVTCHLPNPLS